MPGLTCPEATRPRSPFRTGYRQLRYLPAGVGNYGRVRDSIDILKIISKSNRLRIVTWRMPGRHRGGPWRPSRRQRRRGRTAVRMPSRRLAIRCVLRHHDGTVERVTASYMAATARTARCERRPPIRSSAAAIRRPSRWPICRSTACRRTPCAHIPTPPGPVAGHLRCRAAAGRTCRRTVHKPGVRRGHLHRAAPPAAASCHPDLVRRGRLFGDLASVAGVRHRRPGPPAEHRRPRPGWESEKPAWAPTLVATLARRPRGSHLRRATAGKQPPTNAPTRVCQKSGPAHGIGLRGRMGRWPFCAVSVAPSSRPRWPVGPRHHSWPPRYPTRAVSVSWRPA